jgi:hypothetical protein
VILNKVCSRLQYGAKVRKLRVHVFLDPDPQLPTEEGNVALLDSISENIHLNSSSNLYRSIAKNIFDVQSALNSCSHVPKNVNISLIIVRTLFELISAKHNSIARLKSILNFISFLISILFTV